jgi:hypothetical protein
MSQTITVHGVGFKTTEAYISGGICGDLWMPSTLAGKPFRKSLRGPWGIMDRFPEPVTFREALDCLLMEDGGDFRSAQYTADTRITVIRRKITGPGKYELHVWERELMDLPACADLVNTEAYTGDFMGDED